MNSAFSSVIERFWDTEIQIQTFSISHRGQSVWPFLRMYLYYAHMKERGFFDEPTQEPSKGALLKKMGKRHLSLKNMWNFRPWRRHWIFLHARAGAGRDIYSQDVQSIHGPQSCFSMGTNFPMHGYSIDWLKALARLFAPVVSQRISQADKLKIKQFADLVEDPKLYELGLRRWGEFVLLFNVYHLLLRLFRPQQVYAVAAYFQAPMVAAANALGIETVELQHGVISKYHLGYSYPKGAPGSGHPQKIYCFGAYWTSCDFYPSTMKALTLGNSHLAIEKGGPKEPGAVVVVSQGTIGAKLYQSLQVHAAGLPEYTFYFKLHPSEHHKESRYWETNSTKNLIIISQEVTLTELQNKAEYQLGVYSTGIFEGLQRGCKTILFDLPGVEYLAEFIDRGDVLVINAEGEGLALALDKLKYTPRPSFTFFESLQPEVLSPNAK